jgi:hypothetical protein
VSTSANVDEGEALGLALGANPARDLDADVGLFRVEGLLDLETHGRGRFQRREDEVKKGWLT